MTWPEHLPRGQHVQAPRVLGWRKAVRQMLAGGLLVCVLGGVLIPVLLAPSIPPALADVPMPTAAPSTAPLPDLAAATVTISRVTESIWADQPGDSSAIQYETPRIMQAGSVLVQLTGISVAGEAIEQGTQVVRFTLVDALTGETLGAVDIEQVDGVAGPPVELARLAQPTATYLTVAAQVRGDGTCHACREGDYMWGQPVWHHWSGLLQYDKAG